MVVVRSMEQVTLWLFKVKRQSHISIKITVKQSEQIAVEFNLKDNTLQASKGVSYIVISIWAHLWGTVNICWSALAV